MVGPVGPTEPTQPSQFDGAAGTTGIHDSIEISSTTRTLNVLSPGKPVLFPPISDLAEIVRVLDELAQELEIGDTQRGELARGLYLTIAQSLSGSNFANTINALSAQFGEHVDLWIDIQEENDILQPLVDNENSKLMEEMTEAGNLNIAIDAYNEAAEEYEDVLNDNGSSQQDIDDAYDAMIAALDDLRDAQSDYTDFTDVRIPENDDYNVARDNYTEEIFVWNQRIANLNADRADLGLPPVEPQFIVAPAAKLAMDEFDTDLDDVEVNNGDDPVFVDPVDDRLGPELLLDNTVNIDFPDIVGFIDKILEAIRSSLRTINFMKSIADYSDKIFETQFDFFREQLDPTLLDAITERLPPADPQTESSADSGTASSGSGVALSSQTVGLSSEQLEGIISNAIYETFTNTERTPDNTELIRLLRLLIFQLLQVLSASAAKPSIARLGINGINLAGNREALEQSGTTSQIFQQAQSLSETQPGLTPEQVQSLTNPDKSPDIREVIGALNSVGREVGAPALAGAVLRGLINNDTDLRGLLELTESDPSAEVVKNAIPQAFLANALAVDIAQLAGIPKDEAVSIVNSIGSQIAETTDLPRNQVQEIVEQALIDAGIDPSIARSISGALALRIISETDLSDILAELVANNQIPSEDAIRQALGAANEVNKNIRAALAQARAAVSGVSTKTVNDQALTEAQEALAGVSGENAAFAAAAQALGLNNPNLQALFANNVIREIAPDLPESFLNQIQLLQVQALAVNALGSVSPTIGRLGTNGTNLTGRDRPVQAASAVAQLENTLNIVGANSINDAVASLLGQQPGVTPARVEELQEPITAAVNFGLLLTALNNVGRAIGAPALPGELLRTSIGTDPDRQAVVNLSNLNTTDDITRNALSQLFFRNTLAGDVSKLTGLPRSQVVRIAHRVLKKVALEGNLTQQELQQLIQEALRVEGIKADTAGAIARNLAELITSETDLSNQLNNLTLDSVIRQNQVNTDAVVDQIQKAIRESNARISAALNEAALDSLIARDRLAQQDQANRLLTDQITAQSIADAILAEAILQDRIDADAARASAIRSDQIQSDLEADAIDSASANKSILEQDAIENARDEADANRRNIVADIVKRAAIEDDRERSEVIRQANEDARLQASIVTENAIRSSIESSAQLTRQVRESIINDLVEAGFSLGTGIALADQVVLIIDEQIDQTDRKLARLSETQKSEEELRANIRDDFLASTRQQLGRRAEKIADALENALFGSIKSLPQQTKAEERDPLSLVNQVREKVEILNEDREQRISDAISESTRKASLVNYDVTEIQKKINDPGTYLTHSILSGLSGSDAALPKTAASPQPANIGVPIDIPA